eukprot:CAMPEP_0182894990 /NCGR_PEP_ID=MMETSP0034_2-20130328/25411_1 /TAXON_ID=156128 /ORGANISM="Nephroselmis pyriformis, Strain CCMP717" /LENGTH=433 /DNA_ID=CAMNT_0025028795 /DNA_START=193 /DNA_END=1494 /DNA_ORIENTATION=-
MPYRPTSAPVRRYGSAARTRDPKPGYEYPISGYSPSRFNDVIKPTNSYARSPAYGATAGAVAGAAAGAVAGAAASKQALRAGRAKEINDSVWEELDLHRARLQLRLEGERARLADERAREKDETERLLASTKVEQDEEKRATALALEAAKQSLERESDERVSRARREFLDIEKVLRDKAEREVEDARARMQGEIDGWKVAMTERFDASLEASKQATARALAAKREKELDALLGRLVEETVATETRMKEEYARRSRHADERHSADLAAAHEEARVWQHKYASLRSKQANLERELQDAAAAVKAADWEARLAAVVARERKVKDALEGALSSKEARVADLEKRVAELSADNLTLQRRMREQVGDLEAEYNAQLSSYKRVKEQDLELLQSRIRATIHRKDSSIAELRARLQQAEASMAKREEALQISCQALLHELSP